MSTKCRRERSVETKASNSYAIPENLSAHLNGGDDYCSLIDQLGLVSVTDKKGRITYVNDEFVRLSGYSRRELIGQNHRILNSGQHEPEFFQNMYRLLAKGKRWRAPVKNRAKNGTFYWVDALIVPLKGPTGRATGYLSVHLDITAAVESHVALDERTRLLHNVLDNFPGGIAVYDKSLRMVICNDRQKELLEYPEHLFAKGSPTLEEIFRFNAERGEYGDDDVETLVAKRLALARQLAPHSFERTRPNGVCLEIKGAPLKDGGFVSIHMDVTERKRDQATIESLAHLDALTGLANRRLLRDRLAMALARVERGDKVALLYLDLDGFKSVNDTLGHPAGDALLQAVAKRLQNRTRAMDTVARLGGDEFAILLIGAKSASDTAGLAKRIIKEISAPYVIGKRTVSIGASIGIALAPNDAVDADHLLKCADLALYQVKAEGRGSFRFFEPMMDARVRARSTIETGLRDALEREEFELHYQPIVNIASRQVTSCEALLRWHHPSRGQVPASDFIPVAEETGLIMPIGDWVLRQSCRDAKCWPEHVSVSVNISVAQFRGRDLYETVIESLEGLDPKRLVLEITETTLMQNNDATIKMMERLQSLGVRFALDDFGTGYSSLAYLHRFPFDKIKIDRSFVSNTTQKERSKTLLSAIANIGRALNMTTLAEGVETEAQLESVRAQGCGEAQGFLFSRAIPSKKLMRCFKGPL